MKKYIVYDISFYIHKETYKKTHEMKKILTIKLIFHYKERVAFFIFKQRKRKAKNK